MMFELEERHGKLLAEQDDLSRQMSSLNGLDSLGGLQSDETKLREATRALKQDTQRMEARMNILQVAVLYSPRGTNVPILELFSSKKIDSNM
jgi:hypothetical protein